MRINAVIKKAIFDMDGLIFDSERMFYSALKRAMAEDGYVLTEEIYKNTLGLGAQSVREYMTGIYGASYPVYEMGQRAREMMREAAEKGLPVKKGIKGLLELLRSNGVKCVVASSTETRFVLSYIESAGLGKYFTVCLGGETVKRSKPDPEIFLKALGDTQKSEAVIFEDSENGVRAAAAAGIRVICIPDMKRPADEVLENAFACVADADEAAAVIMEELNE